MAAFDGIAELMERYIRKGSIDVDLQSFSDASVFLELFLCNAGVGWYVDGQYSEPTGEILFSAVHWFTKLEQLVFLTEPEILRVLGDRRERYVSDRIDFCGMTSHSCGLGVIENLCEEFAPQVTLAPSIRWKTLSSEKRQLFAEAELPLNDEAGPALMTLADGVRFERFALFEKTQPVSGVHPEKEIAEKEPFLGLVFNHDSTISRLGDDYKHLPPIPLAPQALKLLKFIHEAGERGRTVQELVPRIVETKRILTTEKSRLNLSEIDIDLGDTGQYVVRCTRARKPL